MTSGPIAVQGNKNVTAPALLQQKPTSAFLAALAQKGGNYNWIPTTSIFSASDKIVQPELNNTLEGSTSWIGGQRTGNIFIQEHCPQLNVSHEQQLYGNFTYQVVKLALDSPTRFARPLDVARAIANGRVPCTQDSIVSKYHSHLEFGIWNLSSADLPVVQTTLRHHV